MKTLLVFMAFLYAGIVRAQSGDYFINDCIDGRTCVSVIDQDTTIVLRIAYIDTPELGQNYGRYSRFRLRGQVQNQTVHFEELSIDETTGWRTGRMTLNGNDVAIPLLTQGAAYPLHNGTPQAILDAYTAARTIAAEDNRGVWGGGAPNLLPWMYRKMIAPADVNGNQGSVPCPLGIQAETECEAFPTFEDAQFARICGNNHIDPDGDGVACE